MGKISNSKAIIVGAIIAGIFTIIVALIQSDCCGDLFNDEPPKIVKDLNGETWRTEGWHERETKKKDFDCKLVPRDGHLIVLRDEEKNIGRARGVCLNDAPDKAPNWCNGAGEKCVERIIVDGCSINKLWHEWYKAKSGDDYSEQYVCLIKMS